MCFAWISEQTAIISLYSINLSVFITEAVFTARYELGLQIRYSFVLKGLINVHITNFYREECDGRGMLRVWGRVEGVQGSGGET